MAVTVVPKTKIRLAIVSCLLVFLLAVSSKPSQTYRTVMITTRSGPICFDVEVADNWFKRTKGLMFRGELLDHHGMLFLYDGETLVTFWMKHVSMSLDILFVSKRGRIEHIHESAQPNDPTPIKSQIPVISVLEIAAGASKRAQITLGDTLRLLTDDEVVTAWCHSHRLLR